MKLSSCGPFCFPLFFLVNGLSYFVDLLVAITALLLYTSLRGVTRRHSQSRKTNKDRRSSFLGAIRTRTTLPTDILELIICRVAVLNRAQYEWDAHSRLLRQALFATGSSEDTVDAVVSVVRHSEIPDFSKVDGGREIELSGKTREMYRAVMAYTDAMTRNVVVGEEVWGSVKMWFPGEREMVEVTATVAAYNCVSRFLVALEVGERVWDGDEEKKS